jgi:multisubunit Na+/H+ antiporter MnhG subunit
MIWLYKIVPLIVAIGALYSFLKSIGIITYTDPQKQKDYEEYLKTKGNTRAIVSFIMFLLFLIMFIREIV